MVTGVSTLGQALDQIERLKVVQNDFTTLSAQLTTGKKTQSFSGLGNDVLSSQRSRASFKSLDVYVNNITNADRRIQLSVTALEEFREQTENFANALVNFSQQSTHQEGGVVYQDDPATIDTEENVQIGHFSGDLDQDMILLQNLASDIYTFVSDLVNAQDGDRYLFGASDALQKPFDDTGTLDAAVSTAIVNWKDELSATNISTDELIADLQNRTSSSGNADAITDTIVGYTAELSAGNVKDVYVRVDEKTEVNYTSLANSQGIRDVLVALSYFKNENLGPIADTYSDPYTFGDIPTEDGAPGATLEEQKESFYTVFNALTSMVNDALNDITTEVQGLEAARAQIAQVQQSHEDQQGLLLSIVSEVEDVDINEVAVKINSLQVTLEAAYNVTARIQQLSLTNYL